MKKYYGNSDLTYSWSVAMVEIFSVFQTISNFEGDARAQTDAVSKCESCVQTKECLHSLVQTLVVCIAKQVDQPGWRRLFTKSNSDGCSVTYQYCSFVVIYDCTMHFEIVSKSTLDKKWIYLFNETKIKSPKVQNNVVFSSVIKRTANATIPLHDFVTEICYFFQTVQVDNQ